MQKQQELTEVARALDPIRLFQQVEQLQQAVFPVEDCTAGKLPVKGSIPDPTAGLET